ncbi:MAG TPA: hypothetical protein VM925_13480, partial [Labilithrix sp.]|nr:hypothetical protein [Labilithrix sp.]
MAGSVDVILPRALASFVSGGIDRADADGVDEAEEDVDGVTEMTGASDREGGATSVPTDAGVRAEGPAEASTCEACQAAAAPPTATTAAADARDALIVTT